MVKIKLTCDAVSMMRRMYDETPEDRAEVERIKQQMDIGSDVYAAREAAGLTQAQLAERVGTTAEVICDVEDAEYQDDPMPLLRRIAEVLDATVEVRLRAKELARAG